MSIMSSFLFYDPESYHHPASKFDGEIFRTEHIGELRQKITNNNRLRQIVCICCPNQSALAEEILKQEHIMSIYLCKDSSHGDHGTNSLNTRVYNITFTQDSGWEFKGRLALLEACIKCQQTDQVLDELHRLRKISERSKDLPQFAAEAVEY